MDSKTFIIKGYNIHDIPSFYEEINRVFMHNESWDIGESLDAFNDMLYGGFGNITPNDVNEILWQDTEHTKNALGYTVTKAYYLNKLQPGLPFNKKYFRDKLQQLEAGTGQTYFDIILGIIAQHPNIILHKK